MDKTKAKSIVRVSALVALSVVAFVAIMAEPADASAMWLIEFWGSKAVGAACIWAVWKLYGLWRDDEMIARFEAWNRSITEGL